MAKKEPLPLFVLNASQKLGKKRVDRYTVKKEAEGYIVYANYVSNSGCDLQCFDEKGIIMEVGEITNYNKGVQMNDQRFWKYVNSLNWWSKRFYWVKRWMVISYESSVGAYEKKAEYCRQNNIKLIVEGYTD